MSIALMTDVWRMDIPTTDKMVLLALADAANDAGVTWLAVCSKRNDKLDLIKKTSLSERAVQLSIKRLCEAGFLVRDERPGRGVIYNVTPPHHIHPRTTCAPAPDAPTPARRAPKPSINPQSKRKSFPRDWMASEQDKAYAASKGLTPKEIERCEEDFRGHFIANGEKSKSTDWSLNWQRWCRVAADRRAGKGPSVAQGKNTGSGGRGDTSFADVRARRRAERGEGMEIPGGQASVSGDDLGWSEGAIDGQLAESHSPRGNGHDARLPF